MRTQRPVVRKLLLQSALPHRAGRRRDFGRIRRKPGILLENARPGRAYASIPAKSARICHCAVSDSGTRPVDPSICRFARDAAPYSFSTAIGA